MFKIKNLSYILILLLVGCSGYEWNINHPNGPRLKFTYDLTNEAGGVENQLTKYISSGELYIYKADQLVQTRLLNLEEMNNPKGIILNLVDSEEYKVVCYANIGTYNIVNGISKWSTARLNNRSSDVSNIVSNDRVYYGTATITPEQATTTSKAEIVLDFTNIHFGIKVQAKGLEGKRAELYIDNCISTFDVATDAPISENKSRMIPPITRSAGEFNFESRFNLLKPQSIPSFDNNIEFRTEVEGESISFNLKEFINAKYNNPNKLLNDIIDRKKEVLLSIVIDKSELDITINLNVTIPDWEIEDGGVDVDDNV